jgi:hypothetical protein
MAKRKKAGKFNSALDAAAQVLREVGASMRKKELIDRMAEKGYWKSPNGQTPEDTVASQIYMEIKAKGEASRFRKAGRGRFVAKDRRAKRVATSA